MEFSKFVEEDRKGVNKIMRRGHANEINEYFYSIKKNYKVLFFGDSIVRLAILPIF